MKSSKIFKVSFWSNLTFIFLFIIEPFFDFLFPDLSSKFLQEEMLIGSVYFWKAIFLGIAGFVFFNLGIFAGYKLKLFTNKNLIETDISLRFSNYSINEVARFIFLFSLLSFSIFTLVTIYILKLLIIMYQEPLQREELSRGKGIILSLLFTGNIALYSSYILYFLKKRKFYLYYFFFIFILTVVVFFPQGRTDVLQLIFPLFLIYSLFNKLSIIKIIMFIVILLTLIIGGFLWRENLFSSLQLLQLLYPLVHALVPFDNFVAFLYFWDIGYFKLLVGKTFVDTLLQPIPRMFFEIFQLMKPEPVSKILMSNMYGPFSEGGSPFTIVGILFLNFGYLYWSILAFIGLLIGIFEKSILNKFSFIGIMIYIFFVPRFLLLIWGSLFSSYAVMISYIVVLLSTYFLTYIFWRILRRKNYNELKLLDYRSSESRNNMDL